MVIVRVQIHDRAGHRQVAMTETAATPPAPAVASLRSNVGNAGIGASTHLNLRRRVPAHYTHPTPYLWTDRQVLGHNTQTTRMKLLRTPGALSDPAGRGCRSGLTPLRTANSCQCRSTQPTTTAIASLANTPHATRAASTQRVVAPWSRPRRPRCCLPSTLPDVNQANAAAGFHPERLQARRQGDQRTRGAAVRGGHGVIEGQTPGGKGQARCAPGAPRQTCAS